MATATLRYYSSNADPATLASTATAGATSISIASKPGTWPSNVPYTIAIDRGLPTEELLLVTAESGAGPYTLTVTRGYNSTDANAHNNTATASVEHCVGGIDYQEANTHASTTSVSTAHGAVVQADVTGGYVDKTNAQADIAGAKTFLALVASATPAATAVADTQASPGMKFETAYWNGSASVVESFTVLAQRNTTTAGAYLLRVPTALAVVGHSTADRSALAVYNSNAAQAIAEFNGSLGAQAWFNNAAALTATDYLVGSASIGRGVVKRATGTSAVVLSTTLNTETTVLTAASYTFVSGRRYRVIFVGRAQAGVAGQTLGIIIYSGATKLASFDIYLPAAGGAGATTAVVMNSVNNLSGAIALTVKARQVAGTTTTAGQITLGNDNNYWFEIEDLGTAA